MRLTPARLVCLTLLLAGGSARADPPQELAALGRYVALAPGCKLRNTQWAQRLDVALARTLIESSADPIPAQRALAAAELQAVNELKAHGRETCRTLSSRRGGRDLRRADELVK